MPAEQNKAIVRRFNEVIQECWRTGNVDLLDDVLDASLVQHIPGIPPDLEGMKQALPMFRAAFPDFQLTIEEIIADEDKVVDRVTWRGTHQGEMMGIPPTGKRVTVTETHIARIAGGKIVERWGAWDALGLMQQLGVVPD